MSEVADGEILLSVKACGLGERDAASLSETDSSAGLDVAGVVHQVGASVTALKVGDRVASICPVDACSLGCSGSVVLDEHLVARLPDGIAFSTAACVLTPGVTAFTAIFYKIRVREGDTVLICGGASDSGHLAIQLVLQLGGRALATASTIEERTFLNSAFGEQCRVIDPNEGLQAKVLKITAGLGVDAIFESRLELSDDADEPSLPGWRELLGCLAVHGVWATRRSKLQLNEIDCEQLLLRSASLAFVYEQAWILSPAQLGRYMHVLLALLDQIDEGRLQMKEPHFVTIEDLSVARRGVRDLVLACLPGERLVWQCHDVDAVG